MLIQQINSKLSRLLAAPLGRVKNRLIYSRVAGPDKTIWVDQKKIKHWYTGNRYDEITWPGQIKGGDWSEKLVTREKRLEGRSGYIGMSERFREGKPWRETKFFREKYSDLLETRDEVKRSGKLEKMERYYENRYDRLFEKIKKEGLRPSNDENPDVDPIYIHIGPKGELIFTVDGNHRFYMAEILGIEKMPVKVWMRHKLWQKIREHILSRKGRNVDEEYQRFSDHPDIISEL